MSVSLSFFVFLARFLCCNGVFRYGDSTSIDPPNDSEFDLFIPAQAIFRWALLPGPLAIAILGADTRQFGFAQLDSVPGLLRVVAGFVRLIMPIGGGIGPITWFRFSGDSITCIILIWTWT